jgi:hypothetical protein
MIKLVSICLFVGAAAALTACAGSNVDYSQQRAISQDIDASFDAGPTSLKPGGYRYEPNGAVPWRIN